MPASLLDPDYQFGTSPLPVASSGLPTDLLGQPLQVQGTAPATGPDQGAALGQTYQMITDAMAKARDQWPSVEEQRGLLAPLPGWQGTAVDAAKQWAEGVMMGTTAPGEVPPPGIVAYHGSPADFNRFSDDFIGTGEGAQAYGRGHYFAGNEGVARQYRDQLGRTIGPQADDLNAAYQDFQSNLQQLWDLKRQGAPVPQELADRIEASQTKYSDLHASAGHMYQVNIGADPEHFLDWDKPLSEQHPAVQQAVKGQEGLHPNMSGDVTGQSIVDTLQNYHGNSAEAAQALRDAGIPGIRYLDQGSRGAGQGSHNYVVFDPATIEILRKYGIAGLMLGGGAAATQRQSNAP